jgi:hypothetical protein
MENEEKVKLLYRGLLAVVMVIVLVVAAAIKIMHPSELLHTFFFIVSLFEIVLALVVTFFWNRWKIWAFLALVFSTWGGYSLYAALFGLPCFCLGVAVNLPRGTSLIVNLLLVAFSWIVLKGFGISRQIAIKLALLSGLLIGLGLASASILYSISL